MQELYNSLPDWVLNSVKKNNCHQCQEILTHTDLISVGIRRFKNKHSLFVEFCCQHCGYREITAIETKYNTVEDLCYILLEEVQRKRKLHKSHQHHQKTGKNQSKISQKEMQDFINFVRKVPTHDEFMKEIGAPQETPIKKKNAKPKN